MENFVKMEKLNYIKVTENSRKGLVLFFVTSLLGLLGAGCASGVGDPCLPEQIPTATVTNPQTQQTETKKGFVSGETYIESSSVQCETRTCGVFDLEGDPSCAGKPGCPTQAEVDERVHCTCRCKAPSARFATCTCPSGFECCEVLERGADGIRGSYCVKNGVCKGLTE